MQSVTTQSNLEKLVQVLTEYFSSVDFVKVAYLFGSTVRGEANCLSDIDVAVLFDEALSKEDVFNFQLKLIGEIATLLKTNNIDLVALNDSPLLLAYNAIRNGIILKSTNQ